MSSSNPTWILSNWLKACSEPQFSPPSYVVLAQSPASCLDPYSESLEDHALRFGLETMVDVT